MSSQPVFPLLKLPLVALRHVFQAMGPADVFLLTLFHPKLLRIGQSIKWSHWAHPSMYIDYCGDNKQATLMFGSKNETKEAIPVVKWNFRTAKDCTFLKKWKVDGKKFRCCFDFTTTATVPVIIFSAQDNRFWWSTIYYHFKNLFKSKFWLALDVLPETMSRIPKNWGFGTLELLPSKNKTILEVDYLENFFVKTRISSLAYIHGAIDGEIGTNSNLLAQDQLLVNCAQKIGLDHILNFKGRHIMLAYSQMTSEDIRKIIDTWQSGTNTKLESVSIFGVGFDKSKVLEGLETKPWSPETRDGTLKNTAGFRFMDPKVYDFSEGVDIIRKSDGLLASIEFKINGFFFFVWKNRFAK